MTTDVVSQSIQFAPLVPVMNMLIEALSGVLLVAIPIVAGYAVNWLRIHGIALSAQAQTELIKQADDVMVKGLSYAKSGADTKLSGLVVAAPNATVEKAANYAMAQAPDILKKLGYDPNTKEGQEAIVRMVVARLTPTAPIADTNVTVTEIVAPAAKA